MQILEYNCCLHLPKTVRLFERYTIKDVRQKNNKKQYISNRNKRTIIHNQSGQALEEVQCKAVGSLSLEVFKTQQDKDLRDLI